MTEKKFHVYTCMEDELRRLIVSGLLPESKPIWSESVLMAKYGIGRNAVRAAISNLEAEGLLKRVHGSGTFVVPQIQRKHPHSSRKKGKTILYLSFPPYSEKTFQLNTVTYFQDMSFLLKQGGQEILMLHIGKTDPVPEILQKGHFAGIIFEGNVDPDFYERYIQPHPCVGIDFINPDFHCSWIDSGKFNVCESAVKYLYRNGHRRIAFLTDESRTWAAEELLRGYRSAMNELGLKIRPEWEICWMRFPEGEELKNESVIRPRDFYDYLEPVFTSHTRPTALVCYDNWRAFSAVEALEKLGLKVPDDISIIGSYTRSKDFDSGIDCSFTCYHIRMKEVYLESYHLLSELIGRRACTTEKVIRLMPIFSPGKTVKTINN